MKEVSSSFRSLVEKYSDRGEKTAIAVGLRPSGVIHLGNMATLGLAGLLGRDIGRHISDINVTICDYDRPDNCEWSVSQEGYVRYFDSLPDEKGKTGGLLKSSMKNIENYMHGLERVLDVNFNLRNLSSVQRDPGFREGLKRVLDEPGMMNYILRNVPEDHILVYPLCPQCRTSDPNPPRYKDGLIFTKCTNPECSLGGQSYEVDVMDSSQDLAVHFFIDPLRDKTIVPNADIHVFGGDYNEAHEGDRNDYNSYVHFLANEDAGPISKIQKIMKVTEIASGGETPDVLIGPKFYARDGHKMSKSRNNGLAIGHLRSHFKEGYVERIVEFLDYLMQSDFKNVDYNVINNVLFDRKS